MTPREALHAELDALLDAADADGGPIEPDAFWAFVAMLAQGRGIMDGLHAEGLDAVRGTPDSPVRTFNERQVRNYHIAVTAALLAGVGRLPGQGSILPGNYQHGVLVQDLLWMLSGDGEPQILSSGGGGQKGLRQAARRRLVGVVHWRMGQTGRSRAQVWAELMGLHGDKGTLDRWQREFGGRKGRLCHEAFEAGRAAQARNGWDASNEQLRSVIELALSAPGRGATTLD